METRLVFAPFDNSSEPVFLPVKQGLPASLVYKLIVSANPDSERRPRRFVQTIDHRSASTFFPLLGHDHEDRPVLTNEIRG